MNQEKPGPIPRILFDISEFRGIERVLWAYLRYLRQLPASPKNVKRRRSVERIQQRLAAQLSPRPVKDMQLFLTLDEVQEVLEALHEFALLVERFFPKNEERDSVIETVNSWRRHLTRIIDEAGA
jgi:uncharacterized protein (DUF2236 family)